MRTGVNKLDPNSELEHEGVYRQIKPNDLVADIYQRRSNRELDAVGGDLADMLYVARRVRSRRDEPTQPG